MARKRKQKSIVKKPKIESEYWEDIEVTDPATGKIIQQRVKVTRYKSGPQCEDIIDGDEDFLDKLQKDCNDDNSKSKLND